MPMEIDEELKDLAALALRNAFWSDFSALVNKYLKASAGLDIDEQENAMGDLTSVYGRDTNKDSFNLNLTICTYPKKEFGTIIEALKDKDSVAIFVQDEKVFERMDNGEWYFIG